ncbi:UDP-3-O-(3-hydroxymyristoyl)glucosamine N-acyltransferase [Denitratisoma sp. agr-D3]
MRLGALVDRLGGELKGSADIEILRVSPLETAGPGDIAFLSNPRYVAKLSRSRAAAVILAPEMAERCQLPCIITAQPYLYFARLAGLLNPPRPVRPGIHPSAVVLSPLPTTVEVGAGVFIDEGVQVGDGVVIGAQCSLAQGSCVGEGSRLYARVSLYEGSVIGRRALIHSGVVIGADGFGFAREQDGRWLKIPQTGAVRLGEDVEVGANTTIDRGALEDTVIGNGVKLDNQIQVAHNVHVGDHTAMAGCVGIAGSARIGKRCTIGGGAIILGHIELADDVHVSSGTLVAKSITRAGSYTGTVPFMPHEDWLRNFARLRHLDAMADKIRALENRLVELEKKS